MVKKLILSLYLFCSGCGFYSVNDGYIDPEFIPYINEYKQDKFKYLNTKNIDRFPIRFKKMTYNDGLCEIYTFSERITDKVIVQYKTIYINPDSWSNMTELERKFLLYHELGHCDLGLDHSTTLTIMYPYTLTQHTYENNPEYFIKLLFTQGR
jgi:hypothetical protein